jgi:hypothetical protein
MSCHETDLCVLIANKPKDRLRSSHPSPRDREMLPLADAVTPAVTIVSGRGV